MEVALKIRRTVIIAGPPQPGREAAWVPHTPQAAALPVTLSLFLFEKATFKSLIEDFIGQMELHPVKLDQVDGVPQQVARVATPHGPRS